MSRRRWVLRAAAAALLQVLLCAGPSWQGAVLLPVPAVTVWTGLTQGRERGAGAGLLAGGLLYLLGGSPWEMGRLALIGGLSGAAAPREGGRWRRCLPALPLLAGWEALRLAALWCGGEAAAEALPLLGRELLLTAGVVPLLGLWEVRRASYGGISTVSLRRSRRQRGRGPALRGQGFLWRKP